MLNARKIAEALRISRPTQRHDNWKTLRAPVLEADVRNITERMDIREVYQCEFTWRARMEMERRENSIYPSARIRNIFAQRLHSSIYGELFSMVREMEYIIEHGGREEAAELVKQMTKLLEPNY